MKTLFVPLVLLLCASCSIKEDRSGCPACLYLSLSEASLRLAGGLPVKIVVADSEKSDTLALDRSRPEDWLFVRRGNVRLEALLANGADEAVAWGGQSDSLWASSETFFLEGEEERRRITLHKRFATVSFIFDKAIDTDPYRLLLDGETAGTAMPGLSPVEGDFRCLLDIEDNAASVRLPAQAPEAGLELFCSERSSGNLLWKLDLRKELAAAGFDWEAEDLADAKVYINLLPLDIVVEVGDWFGGGEITNSI